MRYLLFITLISSISFNLTSGMEVISPKYETIRVGVIDTGFKRKNIKDVKMCDSVKDFSSDNNGEDFNGHGTNIAGLIAKGNSDIKYCFHILKFYGSNGGSVTSMVRALIYAKSLKLDILNISAGGYVFSEIEESAVKAILDSGTKIVAATGNDKVDFDKQGCTHYPSCYFDSIIMVGNSAPSSNFGKKVDVTLDGESQKALGITLSGSSQSTAIRSGQLIREIHNERSK